jgi:Putative Ig domain
MNPHLPRRRTAIRGATAAFAALVAVGGMAAAASGANASAGQPAANPVSNPYSPAYQHSYRHGVMPTRSQYTKMTQWQALHPQSASANNMNYGGGIDGIGVTTGHEKVYLVFYGSQWGTQSTNSNGDVTLSGDPSGEAPYVQEFFKGLGTGGELWSGVATQYCDGVATGSQTCPASNTEHVAYPTGGGTLAGVWVDESTASPSAASGHQLGVEAVNAAAHFGNTTAAANRDAQYVILSPTGTNPDNWLTQGFCAWHDYNGDSTLSGGPVSSSYGDIAFTNLPYITDAGASCGQDFVNSNGTLDGISIVEGHEYNETITDQNPPGGWTNSGGSEVGDVCAWITPGTSGGSFDLTTGTGTYAVQTIWGNDGSNGNGACEASHAIVSNGGGSGNTVTVTNPGNQTGTVGTAVSLQISATDSASGQTLTYTATGLPAGLSISSSGLISGTPTTAATSTVTVTAKDTTGASGSASFTWTINSSGGGGCSSTTNIVKNPNFASGSTSWTASSGVIGQWAPSQPPLAPSTYDAWFDGYGSPHTDTLSQTVTEPAGCTGTLEVWLHIDSDQTSGTNGSFTVKVAGTTLATFTNLNANSGYTEHSFAIPAADAGKSLQLLFTGVENNYNNTDYVAGQIELIP